MLFAWLKRRRRRQLLARPFPAEWLAYLRRNFAQYALLTDAEQARLRELVQVFIAEKFWEGCGGLRMTDEVKVTVAAQACLLVLGMADNYFDRVRSILVYPRWYRTRVPLPDPAGVVHEGVPHLGEAWYRGPVLLAWDEVRDAGRRPGDGHNVVFHEFAHQLDMLDGATDGTPPLVGREQYRRWREVMTAEHERLRGAADEGRPTLLDPYGAKDEAEFFAVATECFFDLPTELAREHPRLYELLRDYYRQDPAERWARAGQLADAGGRP